jgi:predicted RNase H-like HicB family nuclease
MNELIFEVTQDADGGFSAECLTEAIFTQGETWQELREQVKDAVQGFCFDRPKPEAIHLRMVRDEVMALG